jgi:hypothetical protein
MNSRQRRKAKKKKERRMKRKRNLNKHHVIPQSRIEEGCEKHHKNIVMWDKTFHSHYHYLFKNLLPEEIPEFLDLLNTPGMVWTKESIDELRDKIVNRRPTIARMCTLCDRKLRQKTGKPCNICGECW